MEFFWDGFGFYFLGGRWMEIRDVGKYFVVFWIVFIVKKDLVLDVDGFWWK